MKRQRQIWYREVQRGYYVVARDDYQFDEIILNKTPIEHCDAQSIFVCKPLTNILTSRLGREKNVCIILDVQ